MRFFLRFFLIIVLSYFAQLILDWWSVVIAAFLVGFLLSEKRARRVFGKKKAPAMAFLAGFLALLLLWGGMAFYLNLANESILSGKIYQLIFQQEEGWISAGQSLILITALIGGILGGLGAMTGNLLGEALKS